MQSKELPEYLLADTCKISITRNSMFIFMFYPRKFSFRSQIGVLTSKINSAQNHNFSENNKKIMQVSVKKFFRIFWNVSDSKYPYPAIAFDLIIVFVFFSL